ncbi:MAG: M55 family metallopeptidase [Anaerolinea sp.]|nr:M55 family metallopeptidase [Anaerolinea sp.]
MMSKTPLKIYVVCDLEGVAGVVDHYQQCQWQVAGGWYAPYLAQARRLATLELNALVEGALAAGVTEVVAWDGHGNFPGGLDIELLHPACRLVMGAGDGGPIALDERFAGLFQLGLHAMAGSPKAVMAHSFSGSLVGYWVNEMPVGEIWMNCYTAGLVNVPFVFLSGDRAAAEEGRQIVPEIMVAVVKEGLAETAVGLAVAPALSLAPEKAREIIRAAAYQAVAGMDRIPPYRPQQPFHLRAQFNDERLAEQRAGRPNVIRLDAVTVAIEQAEHPWLLL